MGLVTALAVSRRGRVETKTSLGISELVIVQN